jgi:hypothetical protein
VALVNEKLSVTGSRHSGPVFFQQFSVSEHAMISSLISDVEVTI